MFKFIYLIGIATCGCGYGIGRLQNVNLGPGTKEEGTAWAGITSNLGPWPLPWGRDRLGSCCDSSGLRYR